MPIIKLQPIVQNPPEPPKYQTIGSAGMDLRSAESLTLWGEGDCRAVSTGYNIEIPEGYEAQVRPRSGLALKHKVTVINSPGTIDSDFRGELKVILINHGTAPFEIKKGDRIAQLVISPVIQADVQIVENLSETERGTGGFGSTGV